MSELCKDQEIKQAIFDDIVSVSKAARLNGFEFIKAIHLDSDVFTVENDMLTHTLVNFQENSVEFFFL